MKLIDYLNEGKNNTTLPVDSIRYYYDTDSDGYESEDVGITDTHLIFEDIMFDLNTDGESIVLAQQLAAHRHYKQLRMHQSGIPTTN